MNCATDHFQGIQITGGANITHGIHHGVQISRGINLTRSSTGGQIGIVIWPVPSIGINEENGFTFDARQT